MVDIAEEVTCFSGSNKGSNSEVQSLSSFQSDSCDDNGKPPTPESDNITVHQCFSFFISDYFLPVYFFGHTVYLVLLFENFLLIRIHAQAVLLFTFGFHTFVRKCLGNCFE